jgi:hypothetical protein
MKYLFNKIIAKNKRIENVIHSVFNHSYSEYCFLFDRFSVDIRGFWRTWRTWRTLWRTPGYLFIYLLLTSYIYIYVWVRHVRHDMRAIRVFLCPFFFERIEKVFFLYRGAFSLDHLAHWRTPQENIEDTIGYAVLGLAHPRTILAHLERAAA